MKRLFRSSIVLALLSVSPSLLADERSDAEKSEWLNARKQIEDLSWSKAIDAYEPLREAAKPGSAEWTEATYALAACYHHVQPPNQGKIEQARTLYKEVIEKSTDDRYIARAMLSIGRIDEMRDYLDDQIDLSAARGWYMKAAERFKGQPIAGEAVLRAASTLIQAFDEPDYTQVKEGLALLEKFLAEHPNDPLASVMWQYAGDAYFKPLKDYKNMIRCYERVDQLGWVDKGNQGPWYWRAAQVAERYLNDHDVAAKYYRKIILETPTSGKAYESMEALKRLGRPVPETTIFNRLPAAKKPGEARPTTRPSDTQSESAATQPTTQPTTQRSSK